MFEKWWPDLEGKINQILSEVGKPEEPIRSDRELLEEILQLSTVASRSPIRLDPPAVIVALLSHYIALHDQQVKQNVDYQETLDYLQKMHRAVAYISRRYKGTDEQLDELISKFRNLSYSVPEKDKEDDIIPF